MTWNTFLHAAAFASLALFPLAAAEQGVEFGTGRPLGDGTVRAFAETDASGTATRIGTERPLGDGTVRAFAETDASGTATRIGIEMTEEAVATLGQDMVFVSLPLPSAAHAAGYDHVMLDWMPHGHAPGDLFGVPHFDVHFYMTSEAERLAIDPADPLFMEKAANRPASDLMPPNFVPPPEVQPVPAMGEHWVDKTDPVLAGEPFQAVLIYGAWNGKVTFVEPMVTRDLLVSRRDFGGDLGQPARVAQPVSLPGSWSVSFDADEGVHVVSIDALERRTPEEVVDDAPSN